MYVEMSTDNSRELRTSTPFVFTHLYRASSINTVSKKKEKYESQTTRVGGAVVFQYFARRRQLLQFLHCGPEIP